MNFKKFFYKKINSTNDLAIKKIKTGFTKGIIVADYQKKGRGQYGNKWLSFKGNLFMTIFFEIKKNIKLKKITVQNCKIIKKILLQYFKKNITIKYPNDLLVNKKEICGILQETAFNKNVKFILIGIGINLIKDPKIKNYPTTNILNETGFKVKKLNLIKNIEKNYIKNLKLFA